MTSVGERAEQGEAAGDAALPLRSNQPTTAGTGTMVAAGTMWVMLQTIITKGVMVLGQLVLAWLLSREDFGEIGLAYTVTAFAQLLTNPGIDVILIKRGRRFHLWSTPAFYFSLATGLVGCVAILVASPFVAHFYNSPQLVGLLAILAIATPIGSLQLVPTAKLRSEMNFKATSAITLAQSVLQTILTVALAAMGAGVYAFVIPVPIVYAILAVVLWRISRPVVHARNPFRHWRYLIGDSSYIFGQRLLVTVTMQCDNIILGALYGAAIVGPYWFAYSAASQAIRLTAGSLQLVLMAGLSRMYAYSERQTIGAFRATKAIALCGIPLCMLQAVLAGPFLRALYGDKWVAAIPLIQLFSIGLAFDVVTWPACSLLQSRGQFRFLFFWSCLSASVFLTFVFVGAYFGQAVGAALAVCLFFTMFSPPFAAWIFWCSSVSVWDVAGVYVRPLLVGFVGVCISQLAFEVSTALYPLLQVAIAGTAGVLAMIVAARLITPEPWNDIVVKLETVIPKFAAIRR